MITAVKGGLLGWLVERRNGLGVEMDGWRVSTSVHVPVKRLRVLTSARWTVQATAA